MDESLAAGSHGYLYLFIVDVRDVLRRHRKKLRMCVWSGRFILFSSMPAKNMGGTTTTYSQDG